MSKSPVDLKAAIGNIDALPTMPLIAQKILALNLESNEGELAMLKLIEKDPLISAKIIGLSNTAFFGSTKPVLTIQDAAMLLGFERVKTVTLGIAFLTSLADSEPGELDIQGLWLHSFRIALAMRTLSRAMPSDARPYLDEIFFAGLLHDIGYMVLNHIDLELSDQLHRRCAAEPNRPLMEIESELLEMSHAELGAALVKNWNLPEKLIAVLRYHHDPSNTNAAIGQPLVRMVNLAEKILPAYGIHEQVQRDITAEEWLALGINPDDADDLMQQMTQQAAEVSLAN
jgi:putative nucleotidyltransferase with HDIG domain